MVNLVGFYSLTRREFNRFMKVINQALITPLISSILYILIFGLFIGGQLKEVKGVSYLEFIIPGVVMMNVITNAYSNSSFSLFMMKWDNNIHELLASPLSYLEMVFSLTMGGVLRGIVVGIVIIIVSLLFAKVFVANVFAFVFFLIFTALIFSALGITIGLWAEKFDHLTLLTTFLLTPLIFLGGVFYSIDNLPTILKTISLYNPILYMINGLRYGMLGISDVNIWFSGILVFLLASILMAVNVYLFKIGYKMRN